MCGISGFVDFKNRTSLEILEKMNRSIAHRGPDGEGYAIYSAEEYVSVGLGHRRLSIIDLTEGGAQPMHYSGLHITFNGEIYNHAEIKTELEARGHIFESHSDTEVILHSYAEWGSNAVNKFIGMFAFVIYDESRHKIFACRDRPGVKPFFYYWHEGLFLFASELKAITHHPSFKKSLNYNALAAYLQYGYVPTPHCIFEHSHKLKAGHYLTLELNTKDLTTKQYWSVYDAYNKPTLKIELPEAIEETEKLLKNAFQYRMVSDVPVGVFLSGGYDSSCVTALLQSDNTQKIKTFTIGVPDAGLNEAPFAKEIANYLGTDHTEYYCTEKEALEIVPELPFFYDEPFADSSAIPTILVCQIAKRDVTVALSADGGDEVFAGYNRYDYLLKYGQKLKKIPPILRKSVAAVMDKVPAQSIPGFNRSSLFHSRYDKLKSVLKETSSENILQNLTRQFSFTELDGILKNKVSPLYTSFDSKEMDPEFFSELNYMMAIDYETYLQDDIMQKVDRAAMSISLEGREPFLDQRIIEWAARLPQNFKYNNGQKKFILKEIVHKYIPSSIIERPKMGFGIPIAKWLQNELSPYLKQYFSETFVTKQGIFNHAAISKIYASFLGGKIEKADKIWYLLMFQMWYDKWINNN